MVNSATLTSIILHTSCNLNEVNSKWFNDIVRAKTEPLRLQKSLEFGKVDIRIRLPQDRQQTVPGAIQNEII